MFAQSLSFKSTYILITVVENLISLGDIVKNLGVRQRQILKEKYWVSTWEPPILVWR